MDLQFYVLLFTGQKQVHAFGSIQIDRKHLCGLQDIRIVVHNAKFVSLLHLICIRLNIVML